MGQRTGWRALAPAPEMIAFNLAITKEEIYRAARDASFALDLRPAARAVLQQLCGFFREVIAGRALVWPSNEVLGERTGLSERSIRYALRDLIQAKLIASKDSANGKRFAIRSSSGQIIDAFGFDLAPLVQRLEDFKLLIERKRAQKAADKRLREEVTIARRTVLEALESDPRRLDFAISRFRDAEAVTPKRGLVPADVRDLWMTLKEDVLRAFYETGNAGNPCRLIETNNDGNQHSCNKGFEEKPGADVSVSDLLTAAPDANAFLIEPVTNRSEAIAAAAKLRGVIGANASVWTEGVAAIGPWRTAVAVFLVVQAAEDDQRSGAGRIRNPGGYLRAYIRMIAEGRIKLPLEVERLRTRKRASP
ncbi:replication initiation protein RepC [Aureimonas sp. AU40]|uniref:replication initiation protein RepC n=1 Tax=Aureimonas sp. AU40 TaxID=1637747 RepID=UPI000782351B|nr:replication initiation protein RepC [Aureimonas sp. AU40]